MKRSPATITAIVVLALVIAAGGLLWHALTPEHEAHAGGIYYCPMHPTVTAEEPGSCPICGMALVRRTAPDPAAATLASSGSVDPSLAAISLSPEQRVTANVRTVTVAMATGSNDLLTTGRVTFDERRVAQVTSYAAGRVERLYADFVGDAVRRGQPVATIYSPDLFSAQQEYLLALRHRERSGNSGSRSSANELIESARRRLALLGMPAQQIRQIEQSGKPLYTTTITSPVSGVVTRKLVLPQQYVSEGQPLVEVVDLSTVWVEADVYEQQLPGIAIGQSVSITSPAVPGKEFSGTISFIQPFLAGETRTARVRVELANPQLQLKPDMYVTVRLFGAPAAPHLTVPRTAIVDRGQTQYVWIETRPGTYEPRQVTIGERQGDQVVIAAGLSGGESVVVDGAFLLDSEAQLRAATAAAAGAARSGTGSPAQPAPPAHQGH